MPLPAEPTQPAEAVPAEQKASAGIIAAQAQAPTTQPPIGAAMSWSWQTVNDPLGTGTLGSATTVSVQLEGADEDDVVEG